MRRLEAHIESKWKHLKSKNVCVACSGGLDSIVLVSMFHELKYTVKVIHVNYQLRGEDSELDAAFVESFCEKRSIPFRKKTVDLNAELKDGGNLQEKARDVRYTWFREILDNNPDYCIALGHHQDDQIETFFLNLARKSGVTGLASMPEENNGIVRPLLHFSKDDLQNYAESKGLKWREDVSNQDSKYRRNLLRNEILPELKKVFPSLEESVLTLVQNFQDKEGELEQEVTPIYNHILQNGFVAIADFNALSNFALIELFRLLEQPSGIALEVQKLKTKGTKVVLVSAEKHSYKEVVFDETQLSFLSNQSFELPKLIVEEVTALPSAFNKNEIYLDGSKIVGEMRLRTWEVGDRIAPVGMTGTRLISDVVSDAKLNAHEKSKVLVLCDDEHIHWCVGLCVGRMAMGTKQSEVLKISVG